ncbi:hypothetical protein [Leptospirillum ferriphilum]|jgi:hypothetical protein|nr:hypothetical protein [Leptospirillum ferriphilum]
MTICNRTEPDFMITLALPHKKTSMLTLDALDTGAESYIRQEEE